MGDRFRDFIVSLATSSYVCYTLRRAIGDVIFSVAERPELAYSVEKHLNYVLSAVV
jgi:hypothetical protein